MGDHSGPAFRGGCLASHLLGNLRLSGNDRSWVSGSYPISMANFGPTASNLRFDFQCIFDPQMHIYLHQALAATMRILNVVS